MNIQTISMDPRIARIHYSDYRKAVRRHRDEREAKRIERAAIAGRELHQVRVEKELMEKEDEMLLGAYRALMKGERILDVGHTIGKAGLYKETRLPKLAIAPAHGKTCWVRHLTGNSFEFRLQRSHWQCKVADKVVVDIGHHEDASGTITAQLTNHSWRNENKFPSLGNVEAVVPVVPPELRPDNLDEYHILWEAEWKKSVPVDPVLLRRINSRFYTVIAQWDLTPLERSVLSGRLT